MSGQPTLARLLESFFRNRLTDQRNATPATIASYRDALRLLVQFASERTGNKPCALTVQDLDRDLILAFLDHLEQARGNCIHTRNSRLTAVRSFFHHVAANDPGSIGIAQRILAIPIKRSHTEVTHYLSRPEVAALIDAPDQRTSRGRRDRVLLLFLARTGARVSEALNVDAADLQLDRPRPQVLLRGKGRKQMMVPLPDDLAKALEGLLRERGISRHDCLPLFIGTHGQRLTRFGATHIVRRAVTTASERVPQLGRKHVSPHVLRHYAEFRTMPNDPVTAAVGACFLQSDSA
jgi:integrase/recombinase XerD